VSYDFTRFGYRLNDTLAIAIKLVKLNEFLHLAIVGPSVTINHFLGCLSLVYIITKIINHHVAIEYLALCIQSPLGKTIVIIPGLHIINHPLNVAIGRQLAHTLKIGEHLTYIFLRKAKHLIESLLGRDVPANIKATSHIIKSHRTYTRHENTGKRTLKLLEYITIKSIGMGDGMIHIFSLLIENRIRKVIILINDQIILESQLLRFVID